MHAISKHVTEKLPNVTLTFDFLFIFLPLLMSCIEVHIVHHH